LPRHGAKRAGTTHTAKKDNTMGILLISAILSLTITCGLYTLDHYRNTYKQPKHRKGIIE
jgi:hypothetical protein